MSLFKKFAATAMACTMVFGLAACGGTDTAESETGKTYVIGTDTTFAPFEFTTDAGDFVGIDIDLMNAIAEDQGFTVEFNSLGFNAAVQALEAGQVDGVIAGMSITDERKEKTYQRCPGCHRFSRIYQYVRYYVCKGKKDGRRRDGVCCADRDGGREKRPAGNYQ